MSKPPIRKKSDFFTLRNDNGRLRHFGKAALQHEDPLQVPAKKAKNPVPADSLTSMVILGFRTLGAKIFLHLFILCNGMLNNNNNKTVHLLISFQSQSSVQLFVAQ